MNAANAFDMIPAPPPVEAMTYERAVAECTPIVLSTARRYSRMYGQAIDDLAQEGFVELFDIVEKWKHFTGDVPFRIFAFMRLRWSISACAKREKYQGMTARGRGHASLGLASTCTASLDEERDEGGSLHDVLGEGAAQENALSAAEELAAMRRAMSALSAEDLKVLAMIDDGRSHEEIGVALNLTTSRVNNLRTEIQDRLRRAVLGDRAPDLRRRYQPRRAKVVHYEHDGETRSLLGWSKVSGINPRTLRARLDHAWTLADALNTPTREGDYKRKDAPAASRARDRRNVKRLAYDNREQTIAEWSLELNVPIAVIARRVARGWSTSDALTKSVAAYKPRAA